MRVKEGKKAEERFTAGQYLHDGTLWTPTQRLPSTPLARQLHPCSFESVEVHSTTLFSLWL